jgi:hypothetical protein
MPWDTGSPASADPTGYISDRIQNNIGMGSAPIRNWSFVENVPAGTGTVEKQRLTLTNFGVGDTFRITFNGHETADIAYSATGTTLATNIAAALNALVDFNNANTNVTCAYISGQASSPTIFDISSLSTTKWYFVDFSVVSAFTVTNAVGCTGAWTQQQASVSATGTANWDLDVFKCAGTGNDANDAGVDFYVFIRRDKTIAATTLEISMGFGWDTTYHKASNFLGVTHGNYTNYAGTTAAGWSASSSHAPVPDYLYFPNISANIWHFPSSTLNKTGFTYQIKMTKNLIMIGHRVGTLDHFMYVGLFDSLVSSGTDAYPLCMITSNVNSNHTYLKAPSILYSAASAAYNFGLFPLSWTRAGQAQMGTFVVSNATNYSDKLLNGGVPASRVYLAHSVDKTIWYTHGCTRGLLKSDVLCFPSGGTVNLGDTMTIGGVVYTVMGTLSPIVYVVEAN